MTITDRADEAAKAVQAKLEDAGIRTEIDLRNEKIGFKIREAQVQKIPYMLVLGDKEAESGVVAVRKRGEGDVGQMTAGRAARKAQGGDPNEGAVRPFAVRSYFQTQKTATM